MAEEIKEILATVNANLEALVAQKAQDAETIGDLVKRLEEVERKYANLKAMRKVGFESQLPFTSEEKEEAGTFLKWFTGVVTGNLDKAEAALKVYGLESILDSAGGYLVPDDWSPRIVRIIENYGVARKISTRIPMRHDRITMPTVTSGVTVYWNSQLPGYNAGVQHQNIEITESQPAFNEVSLTIDDLYCLVPISNQLLDDAEVDVANLIVTLMAEATAKEEDRVALIGEAGADPFEGVAEVAANVITVASYSALNADHLALMIDSIEGSTDNAMYLMHPTVFNVIRTLKDKQDNYIYQQPNASGEPGTIWGYPYMKTKTLPAVSQNPVANHGFVIFGDFRNLYFADRQSMAIATSTHIGFKKNQTYIRMVVREGWKVVLPETFAILKTSVAGGTETIA
jgi:HK97 family phage major capsid protein